jgi:serpin B
MASLRSLLALGLATALVVASCGDATGGSDPTSQPPPTEVTTVPPSDAAGPAVLVASDLSRQEGDPNAATPVATAATEFAADLYAELAAGEENLVFSPYSVAIALAMTRAGAAGSTAEEMDAVLHLAGIDDPHGGFNALDQALAARSGMVARDDLTEAEVVLNVANALWGQSDTTFEAEFLDLLAAEYGAGMRLVDYRADAEAARVEINDWVADQTEDRIEDLIPSGALNSLTRLVLTNAVYLLAPWELPFDEAGTIPGDFTRLDGSVVAADLMQREATYDYAAGDGWQAITLPYAGRGMAMTVIVPDAGRFAEVEAALDAALLDEIAGGTAPTPVRLRFPSFEFRTQAGLVPALRALGMAESFDPGLADFSGMTTEEDLYIGEVIHEAFIAVDEEGTEAAAATAVVMQARAAAPEPPLDLAVDRPFLFSIHDAGSPVPLFLGRVMDPTA